MLTSKEMHFRPKKTIVIYTLIGLAAIALATQWNAVLAAGHGDGGGSMIVDVLVDASTFVGPGMPFHVEGPIYPEGTIAADGCMPTVDPIGTYHCWGHVPAAGGPGLVSQEL